MVQFFLWIGSYKLNKKTIILIVSLFTFTTLSLLPSGYGSTEQTDVYVSDTSTQRWVGTLQKDNNGYLYPDISDVFWDDSVYAKEFAQWWKNMGPPEYLNELTSNNANYIWNSYSISEDLAKTGEIVLFREQITLPQGVIVTDAKLYITADDAYAFYTWNSNQNRDEWTGAPDGEDGIVDGYSLSDFCYQSDDGNYYPYYDAITKD